MQLVSKYVECEILKIKSINLGKVKQNKSTSVKLLSIPSN